MEAGMEKKSQSEKKTWNAPQLTVYGTVEHLTRGESYIKSYPGSQDDNHTKSKLPPIS
jgi:hypothetical protein